MNDVERFPIYLRGQRRGVLMIPRPLTIEDVAIIQEQVKNALAIIEELFVEQHPAPPAGAEQEAQP